jgi:hypothetical protein
MPELPIYPDPGKEAPGYALKRRLDALAPLSDEARAEARSALRVACVHETLGLTGAPLPPELVRRVVLGEGVDEDDGETVALVRGVVSGLELVEIEAGRRSELDLDVIAHVHRRAVPDADGSLRTAHRKSQFASARPSDPRFVRAKLLNLLEWLASESCRSMFPAERMALWFARFVEIAPFERGNFRTAHLFASHFAVADGFPPVTLRLAEAEAIRSDVERAFRFDTLPLVERFSEAIARALAVLEAASSQEE